MIVPEAPDSVFDHFGLAESGAVVIDQGEFVGGKNVRVGLGLDAGVDLVEFLLEMLCKALVDPAGAVLGYVDSLGEGEVAVAAYIFRATHVGTILITKRGVGWRGG
jgi:hypothetical protein